LQEGRENANIDAGSSEESRRISIETMYVDSVRIENFRTYRNAEIDLLHPDRTASDVKPRFPADILYPNINLVLGNNGMGKSAFLKAIALGCLGPTVRDSGIFPYRFVRREPGSAEVTAEIKRKLNVPGKPVTMPSTRSIIKSVFIAHPQDDVPKGTSSLSAPSASIVAAI
jgi:AAA domain